MSSLYLRHLVATSRCAGFAESIREKIGLFQTLRHSELGLLYKEDRFINQVLKTLIKPHFNCLDIGAHIGSMSYKFTKLAPDGHHLAIEAIPQKAAWLRKRFGSEHVREAAVSEDAGELTFYENLDQPGFSSLSDRSTHGRTRAITVRSARLDDLAPADRPTHFIKIDVEGHEYSALRSGMALLRRDRPPILFEAGGAKMSFEDDPYVKLLGMLNDELDYDVFSVFDFVYERPALDADRFRLYRTYPFLAFNYVATPR